MKLSEKDSEQIKKAKEAGAICAIKGEEINAQNGTIVVACSDGDHAMDLLNTHCKVCGSDRAHSILVNGGALMIPPESPTCKAGESNVLTEHVAVATGLKNISTVVVYTHAPCGVAYGNDLDFFATMKLLLDAKVTLGNKEELKGSQIICFCHVADGEKKRTYFVDRSKMQALLVEEGRI